MDAYVQIQIIALLVALSCSVIGPFLILRKEAMLIDSITHTILLGIVIAFFITPDFNSPILIIGAALMGLITVMITEWLTRTKLVKEDASIGIIFPFLFSIAIILISKYASKIHLDIDAVLLGKIEYAPFDSLVINGVNYGSKNIYVMLAILLLNILFVAILYKELKISTFDAGLAAALGFSTSFIGYSLMAMTSITTVGAFQAVGSILVISFMVGPAAIAYFVSDKLINVIILSMAVGGIISFAGTYVAFMYDLSIAGTISTLIGIVFFIVFIFGPKRGLISKRITRKKQKREFLKLAILYHIHSHTNKDESCVECRIDDMNEHLRLPPTVYEALIKELTDGAEIVQKGGIYALAEGGKLKLKDYFGSEMLERFAG